MVSQLADVKQTSRATICALPYVCTTMQTNCDAHPQADELMPLMLDVGDLPARRYRHELLSAH